MNKTIENLRRLSVAPSDNGEAYNVWLEQADAFSFLVGNLNDDDIVVYAGLPYTFIHAVLVPKAAIDPLDIDDLLSWNFNPYSSWGVVSSNSNVSIEHPLAGEGKVLSQGEQIVFARSFEGVPDRGNYIEILQKIIHVSGLHYMSERNAWCRLDRHGDIKDEICIFKVSIQSEDHSRTVVTCNREILQEYAALTDAVLIRMFDFTRFRTDRFNGWNQQTEEQMCSNHGLYYRHLIEPNYASYSRGVQISEIAASREFLVKALGWSSEEDAGQYAIFIAHDWKNNRVKEISCAPGHSVNYFTESDLPSELSPAFFRPEVLIKYKSDTEKYRLKQRSISCRGAWDLKTYDINEAGQVHTYLVYLRNLPFEEQLYWKSFNEKPKGPISKRAYRTDFEGSFSTEYDSLDSLKNKLSKLHKQVVSWWTLRADDLMDQVHYPVTTSLDEWGDEILGLDQLLVEGFQEKWLRNKAVELGQSPDPRFRSLKLIEECLIGFGFDEDHAQSIVSPLREVHHLRTKTKGHASSDTKKLLRKKAIADHGNLRQHFIYLCKECDEAMETIAQAFNESSATKSL